MTRSRKKIIEDLNNAVIDYMKDYRGTRLAQYFKSINNEIIRHSGRLDRDAMRTIIDRHTEELDISDLAVFGALLGVLTAIIKERRLTQKQRTDYAPILGLLAIYDITSPKRFIDNVRKSMKSPKSANQRKAGGLINEYKDRASRTIERIATKQRNDLIRAQRVSVFRKSREINAHIERMTAEQKPFEMQQRWLTRQYNADRVIMRAVDTEIHANLETAKVEQAKFEGWTKKTWNTQGDDRVRKTRWHNWAANKTIDIDDDFVLGKMKASAPGDMRLPPGERINCRCYLVFSNS